MYAEMIPSWTILLSKDITWIPRLNNSQTILNLKPITTDQLISCTPWDRISPIPTPACGTKIWINLSNTSTPETSSDSKYFIQHQPPTSKPSNKKRPLTQPKMTTSFPTPIMSIPCGQATSHHEQHSKASSKISAGSPKQPKNTSANSKSAILLTLSAAAPKKQKRPSSPWKPLSGSSSTTMQFREQPNSTSLTTTSPQDCALSIISESYIDVSRQNKSAKRQARPSLPMTFTSIFSGMSQEATLV